MSNLINKLTEIDHRIHLVVSLVVRLALTAYGIYHDEISKISYTDVDYKVFTDAARNILEGKSPYDRHTYRYTPLVALLLIPNILLHHSFGKIIFSIFDLLDGLLIKWIVQRTVSNFEHYKKDSEQEVKRERKRKRSRSSRGRVYPEENISNFAMIAWLYNPQTIAISTRGNCDSMAVFFVLATLYFLQCKKKYFIAGLLHGISIHFRLYPIIYSLTYFMYLSKFSFYSTEDRRRRLSNEPQIPRGSEVAIKKPEKKTIFKKQYLLYLLPNFDQLRLVSGCIFSLSALVSVFYLIYGQIFLYETYIYHFIRKDTRHNFSLYFYLQYLTADIKNIGMWQKVLVVLPQIVLLLVLSVRYGLNRFSLNFSVLTLTIVAVIYNTVLTSQYFVWIMAVMPLCLWQIQILPKNALFLMLIWFAAQAAWLLPAYLLEFQGQNTFLFIWIQSVSFFCANIAILGRLIMHFVPVNEGKTKSE